MIGEFEPMTKAQALTLREGMRVQVDPAWNIKHGNRRMTFPPTVTVIDIVHDATKHGISVVVRNTFGVRFRIPAHRCAVQP